jgi:anti-sigma factor ChrR (cupin superfamily)
MTSTIVNADLSRRVVIATEGEPWTRSPHPGVWRRALERHGAESGRATSVVRFDPGARFPEHTHPGGEEILVLEGVFVDDEGSYPAGSYMLNPPGSHHAPASPTGCVLFVKLCQYGGSGRRRIILDTGKLEWERTGVPGVWSKTLYSEHGFPERMRLVKFEPGATFPAHGHPGGEEIFVLEGAWEDEEGVYSRGTWIRNPPRVVHAPRSHAGCVIYAKTGWADARSA